MEILKFALDKPVTTGLAITVPLFFVFKQWLKGGRCEEVVDLTNKVVIITGGNAGLGFETARLLLQMNAHVIITSRNEDRGFNAVQELKIETSKESVEFMTLDLASLSSIREFAEKFKSKKLKLDILINNAGVFPGKHDKTKDGFELAFGTNHLGHFLLTNLLLDEIIVSKGRIINLSSVIAKKGKIDFENLNFEKTPFTMAEGYSNSKLANILFTVELQNRLKGTGVDVFAVHPGLIVTDILNTLPSHIQRAEKMIYNIFGKTLNEGAQTTIYAAISPSLKGQGGNYLSDCKIENLPTQVNNADAKKLWEVSESLVTLKK